MSVDMKPETETNEPAHGSLKHLIALRLRRNSRTPKMLPGLPEQRIKFPGTQMIIVLALFLLGMIGCQNQENSPRGVVTGLIQDTRGNLIVGAQVTSHRSLYKAVSGKDGRYSFTSLDPGSQNLLVERDGFKTASRTVFIDSAEVHDQIDFRLEPLSSRITWSLVDRTSDSVTIDALTGEQMVCQIVYQGEHQPQMRTPFSDQGLEHRLVVRPLISEVTYAFFVEGRTPDGRTYVSATGTFHPLPIGDQPGAPQVPTEFTIVQTRDGPNLAWSYDVSIEPVRGFKIYRGEEDKPLEAWRDENDVFSAQRTMKDDSAIAGIRTRYALAAVDLDGNISSRTKEISFMPAGRMSKTTTWRKSWGMIELEGDLWVPEGVILGIEPGVVVRVSSKDLSQSGIQPDKTEMIIEGTLHAGSLGADIVKFISDSSIPTRKDWAGIRIRTAAKQQNSSVATLEVQNAEYGLDTSESVIDAQEFSARYCANGFQMQNASAAVVTGLKFYDCTIGFSATQNVNCQMSDITCSGGDVGISLRGNKNTSLTGFDLRGILDTGLIIADTASSSIRSGVVESARLGINVNGGVATLTNVTVDAPAGILVNQSVYPSVRNSILVNRKSPGTGVGLEDKSLSNRSYPYNNIFGFGQAVLNANQTGAPILNIDPKFVGGTLSSYDYHLPEGSLLKSASDQNAEIGAYGPVAGGQ